MSPFGLVLASLLAAIIMFGGTVLIAMVVLERPLRKKLLPRSAARAICDHDAEVVPQRRREPQ
jgi:uncharacterized membrane protein